MKTIGQLEDMLRSYGRDTPLVVRCYDDDGREVLAELVSTEYSLSGRKITVNGRRVTKLREGE